MVTTVPETETPVPPKDPVFVFLVIVDELIEIDVPKKDASPPESPAVFPDNVEFVIDVGLTV
jgi:hypothetical protein